jgi:hypothetical protein
MSVQTGKSNMPATTKNDVRKKCKTAKKEEKSHFVTSFLNLNEGFFKKPNRQALHS